MEYTRIYHGKQKGLYGSALSIAPTGAAANVTGNQSMEWVE